MTVSSRQGRKRVSFRVTAPAGSEVCVAGSFNGWDPTKKLLKDKDDSGVYTGVAMLHRGTYEYKFVVNGEWCVDSSNPNFVITDLGTMNSVLSVE
jgi:1,4-alpha-glucan branching enzyme